MFHQLLTPVGDNLLLSFLVASIPIAVVLVLLGRERVRRDDYVLLENSGLYWHLVDVIWIFLLPLFYLAA